MSSEFIEGGKHAFELVTALALGKTLKGAIYNNILLSSSEPGVIDSYDPAIIAPINYVTIFWPGGSPVTGYNLETAMNRELGHPSEVGAEVVRIRRSILGASIGQAALERVPHELREYWDYTDTQLPQAAKMIRAASKDNGLPLTICTTGLITNGEPDTRQMHLFYPNTYRPGAFLGQLQEAVLRAIDRERP